jgi:hypothetical protein
VARDGAMFYEMRGHDIFRHLPANWQRLKSSDVFMVMVVLCLLRHIKQKRLYIADSRVIHESMFLEILSSGLYIIGTVGPLVGYCLPVIAIQVAMVIAIDNAGRHGEGGVGRERQFGYCCRIIGVVVFKIAI